MRELEKRLMKHIDLLVERYPKLENVKQDIVDAYLVMEECYENGGKLLIAGYLSTNKSTCFCNLSSSFLIALKLLFYQITTFYLQTLLMMKQYNPVDNPDYQLTQTSL